MFFLGFTPFHVKRMGQNSSVSFKGASALIMALAGMMFSPCSGEEEVSIVEGTKDGVAVRVVCPKSFPSNGEVVINYSVINQSEGAYRMVHTHQFHDIRIELIGPDGGKIAGYGDKNGWIEWTSFKRRIIASLEHGKKHQGDAIHLAHAWPLKEVGEYRCRLTKRIYRVDPLEKRSSSDILVDPVEIEIPEFTFRVESIDPTFKPAYAPEPKHRYIQPATVEEDEFMSPGRWVLGISLVLTLLGIILRQGGPKKASP
jgi:hypothetical protein